MATSNTTNYVKRPPCIDANDHKYLPSNGVVCCTRCGDIASCNLPAAPTAPYYSPYPAPSPYPLPGSPYYVGDWPPGYGPHVT